MKIRKCVAHKEKYVMGAVCVDRDNCYDGSDFKLCTLRCFYTEVQNMFLFTFSQPMLTTLFVSAATLATNICILAHLFPEFSELS